MYYTLFRPKLQPPILTFLSPPQIPRIHHLIQLPRSNLCHSPQAYVQPSQGRGGRSPPFSLFPYCAALLWCIFISPVFCRGPLRRAAIWLSAPRIRAGASPSPDGQAVLGHSPAALLSCAQSASFDSLTLPKPLSRKVVSLQSQSLDHILQNAVKSAAHRHLINV